MQGGYGNSVIPQYQYGPIFGATNVRSEMLCKEISNTQYNGNFVMMRQQNIQQCRYSGHFESNAPRQQSYDAGARVNEVYAIGDGPYNSPRHSIVQMDGDVKESQGTLPSYFKERKAQSDGRRIFQKRACQREGGCEKERNNNKEPSDQSITSNDRSGNKPKKEKENKTRNVRMYTVKRVAAAIWIIFDCVSDWLEYSGLDNPADDLKQSLEDLNPFSNHLVNKTCLNKEAKDDLVAKYLYFTIFGTVFAVVQLVNIVVQIVRNHKQKFGKDPKTYLHGKTEVFITSLFVDIPQYVLLVGNESICLEPKCGEGLKSKNVRILINVIVSYLKNKWRQETSQEEDKRKCFQCCLKFWCPWCCCIPPWKVSVPCCLGQFESEECCKVDWEWWQCVMNCFFVKFRWCPGENQKWVESGICLKYDDDDDDSPFLGRFSYIITHLQEMLVFIRLLRLFCLTEPVMGWITKNLISNIVLVNVFKVRI